MSHPPYHLRPNKAVDRFMFLEAIRRLEKLGDLSEYTYYGFGGPYLEDFRLLYDLCPEIEMVSIEKDEETLKRQKFHLPCGKIHLKNEPFNSFLAEYQANDKKSIFWLDYVGLKYQYFDDFMLLLGKVAADSMVKITLRAEHRDYIDADKRKQTEKSNTFRKEFGAVMPDPSADPPKKFTRFACFLQEMAQVAAQKALPAAMPLMFLPVSSFYYSDGTGMFTLTGVVCQREEVARVRGAFQTWRFANLDWQSPRHINVPVLSTKERLLLQCHLPCSENAGRALCKALGYLIENDRKTAESKLEQYADFHRYSPYFMRAVP